MTLGGGITAIVALTMGLRHGLDADHLAVVDSLARRRASLQRASPASTGVLFASGHVCVIFVAAIVLSLSSRSVQPPAWLGAVGQLISAATLLLLGALNVRAALRRGSGDEVRPAGLRSRLFVAPKPRSAWHVLGIGALFAVSFDAVVVAGLFAGATGGRVSGAAVAAGLFAFGMLAVSAINGLWVARVLRGLVDARCGAARMLAMTIGVASMGVGAWILFGVEEISDFSMSLFVIGTVAFGYAAALWLARRPRAQSEAAVPSPSGAVRG